MSWLYTIVFAGLVFSSHGNSATGEPVIQNTPAPAAVVIQDETEKFDQTYPLNANGRLSISNINGSIVVEAWDRNEVRLEYTKTADSKERLSQVQVRIDSRPDAINVETDYGNWKSTKNGEGLYFGNGRLQVAFHLMVPRTAFLNEVETVNGSVTVSNFTNYTKISTVNGTVNATNLRGNANLSTVNGEVVADFDRLETGTKVVLSTVNGHVNLVIPSDASATVNADSLNGNITNDFGLRVRKGKYIGRDLYGRIGSGDVRIKLDSVNGALAIGRKNDGKTPSPAVDLLPQKEKDDQDWDKDDDDKNNNDKSMSVNKEAAKAVRDGQRETPQAARDAQRESSRVLREAQREIERAQPEIAKITSENINKAMAEADKAMQVAVNTNVQTNLENLKIQQKVLAQIANIDFSSQVARVEQKSDSFPVKGVPKVTVEAKGCAIVVRGWDKSEVQYRVTQFSDAGNRGPIQIREDHSDSAVNINIENPDSESRNGNFFNDGVRVRIEVFVPRKSNLKIKTNGEIRLDGVSGDIDLAGSDESINVRDVYGTMHLANSDGRIRVVGFTGDLDVQTSDGEVYLEGVFVKLTGRASDGHFILTVPTEPNFDVEANVETLTVENLGVPAKPTENVWRFGNGGPTYHYKVGDGEVVVRRANTN